MQNILCIHHSVSAESQVAAATPVFAPKVTYKLDYAVRLLSPVPIAAVESVNGSLNVTDDPRNNAAGGAATHGYAHAKTVSQAADVSDASRDFQVVVELAGALPEASVALQRSQPAGTPPAPADKGRKGFLSMFRRPKAPQPAAEGPVTHALVTFCPRLPEAAAAAVAGGALDREIWFVIDCSGSMGGTPIEQVRDLVWEAGRAHEPLCRSQSIGNPPCLHIISGDRQPFQYVSCAGFLPCRPSRLRCCLCATSRPAGASDSTWCCSAAAWSS